MKVDLSILNAPLDNVEAYLEKLERLEYIHMDIMDGLFVPNLSFDSDIVKRCSEKFKDKIIDTHLMVEHPENKFIEYVKAGSDLITFHIETGNVKENIDLIHRLGVKAGLSIKPSTDVRELEMYLKDLDIVLIMSVEPGKGGQKFIESSIEKVKFLYEYRKEHNLNYLINIDGGINKETYMYIKDYCDLAVVGSAITKAEDYVSALNEYNDLFK